MSSTETRDKAALRKEWRDRRNRFVAALPASVANLCFRQFPGPLQRLVEGANCLAFYHAKGSEAPTERLMMAAWETGKTVALPAMDSDCGMIFREFGPGDTIATGRFGVGEPPAANAKVDPDILFVPLVGFDHGRNRLGQGGGHYDRYFAKYPDPLRIGLAWSVQLCDAVPAEAHDVPLDAIVTEAELLSGPRLP